MSAKTALILTTIGVQTKEGPFASTQAMVDTGSEITVITKSLADHLNLRLVPTGDHVQPQNGIKDLGEHPVYEANILAATRDGGSIVLDGYRVVVFESGHSAVIGVDFLSQFNYQIANGILYLLGPKPKERN